MATFRFDPNNTEGHYPTAMVVDDGEIKKGNKILATDLVDLYDTAINDPQQDQTLVVRNGKWVNEFVSSSSCNLFNPNDLITKKISKKLPIHMGVGGTFTLAVSMEGYMYFTGEDYFTGMNIQKTKFTRIYEYSYIKSKARYVFCGYQFAYVIREDGSLWSTGKNNYGQLGLGSSNNEYYRFTLVDNTRIWKYVSCGMNYALLVDEDNNLFVVGDNQYGQLGLGDNNQRNVLTQVPNVKVSNISAGYYHSAIIDSNHQLFVTGRNDYGQLGLDDHNNRNLYEKVDTDTNWYHIACGGYHTVGSKLEKVRYDDLSDVYYSIYYKYRLLNDFLVCYSTGRNNLGQLGLGYIENNDYYPDYNDRQKFTRIKQLEKIKKYSIQETFHITCNEDTTYIASSEFGSDIIMVYGCGRPRADNSHTSIITQYTSTNSGIVTNFKNVILSGPYTLVFMNAEIRGDNTYGQLGDGTVGGGYKNNYIILEEEYRDNIFNSIINKENEFIDNYVNIRSMSFLPSQTERVGLAYTDQEATYGRGYTKLSPYSIFSGRYAVYDSHGGKLRSYYYTGGNENRIQDKINIGHFLLSGSDSNNEVVYLTTKNKDCAIIGNDHSPYQYTYEELNVKSDFRRIVEWKGNDVIFFNKNFIINDKNELYMYDFRMFNQDQNFIYDNQWFYKLLDDVKSVYYTNTGNLYILKTDGTIITAHTDYNNGNLIIDYVHSGVWKYLHITNFSHPSVTAWNGYAIRDDDSLWTLGSNITTDQTYNAIGLGDSIDNTYDNNDNTYKFMHCMDNVKETSLSSNGIAIVTNDNKLFVGGYNGENYDNHMGVGLLGLGESVIKAEQLVQINPDTEWVDVCLQYFFMIAISKDKKIWKSGIKKRYYNGIEYTDIDSRELVHDIHESLDYKKGLSKSTTYDEVAGYVDKDDNIKFMGSIFGKTTKIFENVSYLYRKVDYIFNNYVSTNNTRDISDHMYVGPSSVNYFHTHQYYKILSKNRFNSYSFFSEVPVEGNINNDVFYDRIKNTDRTGITYIGNMIANMTEYGGEDIAGNNIYDHWFKIDREKMPYEYKDVINTKRHPIEIINSTAEFITFIPQGLNIIGNSTVIVHDLKNDIDSVTIRNNSKLIIYTNNEAHIEIKDNVYWDSSSKIIINDVEIQV